MSKRLPKRYHELARVIGEESAQRLCREYGGDRLYIPKADGLERLRRNKLIRQEYNGFNKAALAQRYGLSTRSVEMILRRKG